MFDQKIQSATDGPAVLQRYHKEILQELHRALLTQNTFRAEKANSDTLLQLYGEMQYHLGWVDQHFRPADGHAGKLLRPTILLLSYELAWTQNQAPSTNHFSLRPALPAAATVELAHNFTLLHDDIQDGDVERRHRPTVWSVWGIPQAILVGDALVALTRLHLWKVLNEGVATSTALNLAKLLDTTLLKLTEGQHLDIAFEQREEVSLPGYEQMISRKTAALMRCAAEMGAALGTSNQEMIEDLARFGHALGLAFQIRDDMLGVWATEAESGKQPASDIYRRKKSLPILHAFQSAQPGDQRALAQIYSQNEPITQAQVREVLAILTQTQTRQYCNRLLAQQCHQARQALAQLTTNHSAHAVRALNDLEAIIDFVERS